ncbi:hypothetical protein M0805_001146 [Coniferiporia weirii]|nr:hypothetical protein M0805_001146 [Coniferiporia weirii]
MSTSAAAVPQQHHQSQSHARASRNSSGAKHVEPPADAQTVHSTIFKGPKRKRLVKACDPCHKSKRRCDGTAPCGNWWDYSHDFLNTSASLTKLLCASSYFASKDCTYTDSSGRPVAAPNAPRPETTNPQSNANPHNINSISVSAVGAVSASYLPQETFRAQSQAQARHPAPALSLDTDTPGPSYFATSDTLAPPMRFTQGDQQTRGALALNISQDPPSPRKRLKSGDQAHGRGAAYGSQTQATSPTTASHGVRTASLFPTNPDSGSLKGANSNLIGIPSAYDKHAVRELVSLFFAHCHPHRLIIHPTSFFADLCRNRVPSFLLNAICAVAAPLSQNPLVRVSPVREAGQKFADAALETLFDAEGRVMATGVEAAQALVLLQTYKIYKEHDMAGELGFFDLALRILHPLHDLTRTAPPPEPEPFVSEGLSTRGIQSECARRTFWLIHIIELLGATFTRRPTTYSREDVAGVRLPSDETSFDLGVLVSTPEYLDSPALKTRDASELGHVTRIATLLREIEYHNVESPDAKAIANCENQLEQWAHSLSDHLKYNIDNLRFQLSLWETNSNTSTWCYCFMHILHACSVLALSDIRKRLRQGPSRGHQSALVAVPTIMNAIGPRARNSILMGSVLWLQYCGPHASNNAKSGMDDPANSSLGAADADRLSARLPNVPELLPQLNVWIKEWEEFWGPTHEQHIANNPDDSSDEQRYNTCYSRPTSVGASVSAAEGQVPSTSAPTWTVPDVVIDPVLRADDEPTSGSAPQASPALSSTSTLRGRDQPSLPSLKSSGLLDVFADDPLGRASGASTPVKQPPPWPLSSSSSPRPPLLSPGLPSPTATGLSGNASFSTHPHLSHLGTGLSQQAPTLRVQAPDNYQHNGSLSNPGLITVPSVFQESMHTARDSYGASQNHVSRHGQMPSYFERTPSPPSPHEHMLASHGTGDLPAR